MYRIILIDDEPLILAGIASLIRWEDYDCTIIGKSTIPTEARQMILEMQPDIVITDIRMPVLNGLELVESCKNGGAIFSFIVLTNLEEFSLAKKALSLGAIDYLVKLNLKPEELIETLERAKKSCDLMAKSRNLAGAISSSASANDHVRTYLNQILLAKNPSEELSAPNHGGDWSQPFLLLFSLCPNHIRFQADEDAYDFRSLTGQLFDIMVKISDRYFAHSLYFEYDGKHTYLLAASLKANDNFQLILTEFCNRVTTALTTYFELNAVYGASSLKDSLAEMPYALSEALTSLEYYYYNSSSPLVFYTGQTFHQSAARHFNINIFKKDLSASIQQNDSSRLREVFHQILDLFSTCQPGKEQATSACINIYTYLYSFFEIDQEDFQEIFPYTINIAEQLGHFNSLSDILTWLESFCDKLCTLLSERRGTRSDTLVEQARAYINSHYSEKLALADVAEYLNISSGHLSNTFKKFTGVTISDYIAAVKIEHAKELIDTHKYLMYEISDMLGFENPYYFSKVFKKVTGIAPREYENMKKVF